MKRVLVLAVCALVFSLALGGLIGCGNGLDEEPVDAPVSGKLRMKGCGHDAALSDQRRKAIALSQNLDAGAN